MVDPRMEHFRAGGVILRSLGSGDPKPAYLFLTMKFLSSTFGLFKDYLSCLLSWNFLYFLIIVMVNHGFLLGHSAPVCYLDRSVISCLILKVVTQRMAVSE